MNDLVEFRKMKDEFFAGDHQSPLTHNQKHGFEGLQYFPENKALRLEVDIEKFPEQKQLQMQTSTGGVQTYTRYGRVKFQVEGQDAELTVYASHHSYFPRPSCEGHGRFAPKKRQHSGHLGLLLLGFPRMRRFR